MNISENSTITLEQGKIFNNSKSKKYLNKPKYNPQETNNDELIQNYNSTLEDYNNVKDNILLQTQNYISRTSQTNPLLNKIILFKLSDNENVSFYVTNKGVAKRIPSKEIYDSILGNNGCPSSTNIININIPWSNAYTVEGTIIPTSPPLLVGTNMILNQSCGGEGTNVYAKNMVNDTTASYQGCFQDDTNTPTMTFMGGSVPSTGSSHVSSILNGDFSQPTISNNSYNYINSASTVPGWVFNAILVNNSSAWGFVMPYPFGNQCVSIQRDQSISQVVDFNSGSYNISFYACGRNCCDGTGTSNPIAIQLNGTTISTIQPPVNVWKNYSIAFNVVTNGKNTIIFKGTTTSTDKSTAIQNVSIALTSTITNNSTGIYTYESCKNTAIDGGYQYFALQSVNPTTQKGYCAVSNDIIAPTQKGESYSITGGVVLWSSNTANNSSNIASLTVQGSLSVLNSGGVSIFSTPAPKTTTNVNKPANYIGCYKDSGNRAMSNYNGNGKYYDTCASASKSKGDTYFGLQYVQGNKTAECWSNSNLDKAKQYGLATNCTQLTDGTWVGGGWSNAVYNNVDPTVPYFLILQDDGNMCIYKGSGPEDNQGYIWCSFTNGKQQKPNPTFKASKGKFGKNYISSTSSLAIGDFIGSNDGSIYLMMNNDGNLVLYTSQNTLNCKKLNNGMMGGGEGSNAIYKLNQVGIQKDLQKIAYIDQNSNAYLYPSNKISSTNTYSKVNAYNSEEQTISGLSTSGGSLEQCKQSCNSNVNCYGVEYNTDIKTCIQKNNSIYNLKSSNLASSPFSELYVKDKTVTEGFSTNNIDTIKFNNYKNSNKLFSNNVVDTISNQVNDVDKQKLDQLDTRLSLLSSQLNIVNDKTGNQFVDVDTQSKTNTKLINLFTKQYNNTQHNISNLHENMPNYNNIVDDSNIVSSSAINKFIIWCVLFIILILVAIKVYRSI